MVLAFDPDLVVLDEPTAGLDPNTRHQLVVGIARMAQARVSPSWSSHMTCPTSPVSPIA